MLASPALLALFLGVAQPAEPAPKAGEPAAGEPGAGRDKTEPVGDVAEPVEPEPIEPEPVAPEPVEPEPVEPEPEAPPMPAIEQLPNKGAPSSDAPPQPKTEEIPNKGRRRIFDVTPPTADRPPAGTEGGSFFDPGRLGETGPTGGVIQIRGFVAGNFFVTQRTNTAVREGDGSLDRIKSLPFFDVSSATLYVGAPIFADIVYARMGLEFVSIPNISTASRAIIGSSNRLLLLESAAIEVNPFAWAKRAPRWFSEGFKLTGGVFIMPFGLEDEEHAAPANWFSGRPRAMTSNRVYPGTWSDAGLTLKWKPTFGKDKPVRPVEIDFGFANSDPCTQTRWVETVLQGNSVSPECERNMDGRLPEDMAASDAPTSEINAGFFGIAPDNNQNKAITTRVQFFPLPAINFGSSFIWAKHPAGRAIVTPGESSIDVEQLPTWRVGGHLDVNFDDIFQSPYPLPMLRGEFVYGVDEASTTNPELQTRKMMGGYAQIAQALFRRKKTRLPGLFIQYRFDHADPDIEVPGTVGGVDLAVDPLVTSRIEQLLQSHTVGLRFIVLPRFILKTEYTFVLEDGGVDNKLFNDLWVFEAVVDF